MEKLRHEFSRSSVVNSGFSMRKAMMVLDYLWKRVFRNMHNLTSSCVYHCREKAFDKAISNLSSISILLLV